MATNRGRWWARHLRLQHHQLPCEPGCPVCAEIAHLHPDYSTPPPPALTTELR